MKFNINIKLTALGVVYVCTGYLMVRAAKEIRKASEAEVRIVNLVLEKELEKYKDWLGNEVDKYKA